jgi:AsmA-like C-terminal region/AsmA family
LESVLQTTLLGLAIAIILALVAALVGPMLIDWGNHRALFEAEASRLIGVNVRVTGPISARLLPSPQLTLNEISIGEGRDRIRARSLGIEFGLGPLMRGEWRAAEMHLVGPQVSLALDASGRVRAPNLAVAFKPDELSIDRLSIEGGTIVLTNEVNSATVALERVWFTGEARSLAGPLKGEGGVIVAGQAYPYRVALGRLNDDGALKLRANVDPADHPLGFEADGTLTFVAAEPRFEGVLSVSRAVGIAQRNPGQSVQPLTQPWRASAKVKATGRSALMENVEFQYGSEDQGTKLSGVANFDFGARPRLSAILSGRQIDLDRAVSGSGGSKQLVGDTVRKLAELGASTLRTTLPVQLGVSIDLVTLGGNTIQNLRGDISNRGDGWDLDRLEFRAPGMTQMRVSGHVAVSADSFRFNGPTELESSDAKALAAWLEGRSENQPGDLRPMSLSGEVAIAADRIAVDGLKLEFNRRPLTGLFAYFVRSGDRPPRLEAQLSAQQFDFDAALDFGKALLAGSAIERPGEISLVADVGRATFAGNEAGDLHARIKSDGNGLQFERLSVGDFAGGSFALSGRIETGGRAPRGMLSVDCEAKQTQVMAAAAAKLSPKTAAPFVSLIERAGRAKFRATLDLSGDDKAATVAQLAMTGDLDDLRIDARARARGDWAKPSAAEVRVDATVDSPRSAALLKFMNLDGIVTAGNEPAQLKLQLTGPLSSDVRFDASLSGGGLSARATGSGRLAEEGIKVAANLQVREADMRPLRSIVGAAGGGAALPFKLTARLSGAGNAITVDDIDAKLAGSAIRGRLAFGDATPRRIDGMLELDAADIPALIARGIGLQPEPTAKGAAWSWSSDPFDSRLLGKFAGQVRLKIKRADLLPQLAASDLSATLRLGKDELSLENVAGAFAGGRLSGSITFHQATDGLTAQVQGSVAGANAAALLASATKPPISGAVELTADMIGTGLSPVALIGSLKGSGKAVLINGRIANLDPRAFDVVTRAVDQGLIIDNGRISDLAAKSLEGGQLSLKRAESVLQIAAGQVRLTSVSVDGKDTPLSAVSTLDLTDGSLAARIDLSGLHEAAGARPKIFVALNGPLTAPTRSIDVSALTGWLTLRAVENQTKKLRAFENVPPQPQDRGMPKTKQAPALPAPIDIRPVPAPRSAGQPAPSVRSQN